MLNAAQPALITTNEMFESIFRYFMRYLKIFLQKISRVKFINTANGETLAKDNGKFRF